MEALVANIFPNITSVQALDNATRCLLNLLCPVHTYRLTILKDLVGFFCSDIDHNDNYYHDPYIDMSRLSLVDKSRVIGQIQTGIRKSGW